MSSNACGAGWTSLAPRGALSRLHGQLGSIVAGRGGDVRCSPPAPKSAFRCRHCNDLPLGAEPRQQTSGCCPKVEAKIQDVWQRRDCNDAGMVSGEATIQNVCQWRGRDDSGAVSEASDAPIASARLLGPRLRRRQRRLRRPRPVHFGIPTRRLGRCAFCNALSSDASGTPPC